LAWQEEIQENIKRGILEILILELLSFEDMYGYQIKIEIDKHSGGLIDIKEGSLYGPLYRMIEKKFITEHKEMAGVRRFRIYYHLEPLGKEFLKSAKTEFLKIVKGTQKIIDWREKGNG
jgi:PadR family transcriptional regulator PadR